MPRNKNPQFDLEYQYQLFLQRMSLIESQMHPQQKIQLKQAFMGAWGQSMICMRDEVSEHPEAEAVQILEDMTTQLTRYWNNQVKKPN